MQKDIEFENVGQIIEGNIQLDCCRKLKWLLFISSYTKKTRPESKHLVETNRDSF